MSSDVFLPGEVFGGKYRVVRVLGEGGMAIVLEAEHIKLGHKVALKVLRAALLEQPSLVSRFEREGRALSKLRSPNVVRVFDVDTTPAGAPYLVMEFLEGGDLEMELHARGPLPIAEAVHYTLQACSALQEAHARGIVHRDIKPTNVFLATEGATRVVKVLDFGIATDTPLPDDVRLTRTETVMGTPLYMAPEQFRSARDVDARADIWSLGATLYELITGAAPFTGTATTIGVAIVSDPVRPIEGHRPEVPVLLREVILRALEKDPTRRYQTVQAFAEALRPFGEGVVIATRSSAHSLPDAVQVGGAPTLLIDHVAPNTTPGTEPRPATGAAVTHEPRDAVATSVAGPRARSTRWAWAILAVAIPLVATIGLLARRGHERPTAIAAPATTPPSPPPSALPPLTTNTAPPLVSAAPTAPELSPPDAAAPRVRRASPHQAAVPLAPHPAPTPSAHSPSDPGHPLFFPR